MKHTEIKMTARSAVVLEAAHRAWVRMAPLRQRRRRYLRYTYGDQWSDTVTDRDGRRVTEREQLTLGGRAPLTNNLIRRMVKAVVGRYRMSLMSPADEASPDGSPTPQTGATVPRRSRRWETLNRLSELDARTLEEFLISGMAIHRVCAERRAGGEGVWVDPISPDRFFINAITDPRGADMELVGCLHDMSLTEVVMRFGHGDRSRCRRIRELYGYMESSAPAALSDTCLLYTSPSPRD